jgi:hypothetical protein
VKSAPAPCLREVRRGDHPDELEPIDSTGSVTILVAYGVNVEERARVRETALRLMQSAAYEPGRP